MTEWRQCYHEVKVPFYGAGLPSQPYSRRNVNRWHRKRKWLKKGLPKLIKEAEIATGKRLRELAFGSYSK